MASNFIVLEKGLLKSEAFRSLNGTAKNVYFDFRMKCKLQKSKGSKRGGWRIINNGQIEYTYSEAEKKVPKISRSAFMRAIDALVERGFIDIDHSGSGGIKGDKSKYSISERWRAWGTDDFEKKTRPRDTRSGRGFAIYWKKNMGIKNDNPTIIKNDN